MMKQWLEFWSFHLHPVCSWSVSQLHKMLSIDWIQRKMLQIQIQLNAPIQMSTGVLCKWCTPFLPSYIENPSEKRKKEREQDSDRQRKTENDSQRASGTIYSEIQQLCVNLQYNVTTWLWAILCGLFTLPCAICICIAQPSVSCTYISAMMRTLSSQATDDSVSSI